MFSLAILSRVSRILTASDYLHSGMGLEVCTTLGMLNAEQAVQLKEAGLTAYNHNLDTSREVRRSPNNGDV